jgi:hypothetical protein
MVVNPVNMRDMWQSAYYPRRSNCRWLHHPKGYSQVPKRLEQSDVRRRVQLLAPAFFKLFSTVTNGLFGFMPMANAFIIAGSETS